MLTVHELLEEVDRLPAADKWQLVKHVLDTLQQEQTASALTSDYHQFLQETYGALRDTPFEREMETLSGVESEASRLRNWKATIDRTAGALADEQP